MGNLLRDRSSFQVIRELQSNLALKGQIIFFTIVNVFYGHLNIDNQCFGTKVHIHWNKVCVTVGSIRKKFFCRSVGPSFCNAFFQMSELGGLAPQIQCE